MVSVDSPMIRFEALRSAMDGEKILLAYISGIECLSLYKRIRGSNPCCPAIELGRYCWTAKFEGRMVQKSLRPFLLLMIFLLPLRPWRPLRLNCLQARYLAKAIIELHPGTHHALT